MTVERDEQLAARAMEAEAYEDALRLLRPLVEHNSEYALLTLGWIYETGAAGTANRDAAQIYYQHAAAGGSAAGYRYLGGLLLGKGEELQARAAFEAGTQLGDDECRRTLQQLDEERIELLATEALDEGAYEEAIRLLLPLVELGSEYALLTLGWIHETGGAGAPDYDAAQAYYERAAAAGSTAAYAYLGGLLLSKDDEVGAAEAYKAGADRGNDDCKEALQQLEDDRLERLAERAIDPPNMMRHCRF